MSEVKEKVLSEVDKLLSHPYVLIVNNDDHNTFDWVISCLIKICNHTTEQASQCAYIIHFNGQCDVKRGSKEVITKMKQQLADAGLSVTVEKSK